MKKLNLFNRSGMGPDGMSRKGRYSLDPILSRLCLASLICLCMLTIGSGNVWGAVGGTLKTYNTNSSTFSTGYKRQSGDNFVWWGQKNYYGANSATNHGKLLPTAADLPVVKAHNSSATTSTTGLYYCYTSEAVSNVGAVQITFSARSGSSTVNAYVVSSSTAASSGSATWTKLTLLTGSPSAQGANVASAGTYTFTFPKETTAKYYGVVFVTSSYWRATGFQMKLLEGCTAPTAVAKGTLTSSSFGLTITDAQNAGNYDIYFSKSSTAPTADLAAGSFSTVNTKTPTVSSGVSASTTYYVWARSSKTVSSVAYKSAWVALTGNTLTTPSAGTSVSYSKAATTNGSFTLSPASSVTTSSAQTVNVTCSPDPGYYVSSVSATNPATGTATPGGSGNARTVVYSSGANGESTISVTFSPIWYLKGDFNSWDTSDPLTNITSNVATVTKSLSKTTGYEFKVYNAQEDAWYGNNGKIIDDVSGWTFSTSEGNCKVFATVADDYTFKFNISTKAMQVQYPSMTHPNDAYVYLTNWWDCYVHYWYTDGGGDHALIDWGYDTQLSRHEEICETDYWCVPILDGYPKLAMKDNAGDPSNTTGDQTTASNAGKYITHNGVSWGWHDFDRYTVSYAGGGGTGSMSSHTDLCPGSSQALSANAFTKDHYHFTGWVANVDVTINSATVTQGTLITGTPTIQNVQSDITLTAQWEINSNTLTWNWNGGSTSSTTYTLYPATSGSVNYNAAITYPANNTMSKTGYNFNSWSSSATNMPDEALTITANWTAKTTSITLNKNNEDASGSTAGSASWTYDQTTKNSLTAATRTGYNVDGYYTAASSGTKILNADGSLAGNSITVDAVVYTSGGKWAYDGTSLTLYAHWTLKTTTVSFNQNSGTGGQTTTKTATYSQAMPTPITTPTRAGYTFTGYYENSGGTGTKYYNADGTSATNWNKEDATWTLYAGWTAKEDTYKTALHTGESGWTSYASGVTKSGAGYTIPAPSSVTKGVGSTCEDLHYHFAGWVADDYKGSPSGHIITATGTTDATGATYWAVWEKEGAGGGSLTKLTSSYVPTEGDNLVIVAVDGDDKYALYQQTISSSYVAFWNFSNDAATVGADDKNYVTLVSDGGTGWYLGDATNGYVYNGSSNNLTVDANSHTSFSITWNSSGFNIVGNSRWLSCRTDLTGDNDNKYRMGGATSGNASGTALFDLYKYVGVSFEDPKAVCEACVATPSISGVELTGSAFSTTSVPVQATGASAGENCSLAEYGFYWGGSANPTTNETASDNLSTGTFSATLTGPFVIGTTYHYRAYGTNEADITGYSSDATFTLRQVSFNMHSHGGDAPATQVVPEGGKVTNPGNPSATGYTFDGWWANSTFSGSAWDFSTNTVGSGDVVLHAKWTEKPKYTITLNAGNGTISDANWTNTSGSTYTRTQANGDEEITLPTPSCNCAGWVFQGWSTTSKDNAASFTPDKEDGASFVPAANVTYYAVYRANATGGTTFNKITSTGDLTTGNYIFMSSTGYAMKNVVTSSRMDEVGGYTASNSSQTIDNANLVWTIAKFSSQVVIKNGANYLGIDANNNICLTTTPHFFTYTYNGTNSRWEFTSATLTDYQLAYSTAHGGSYSYFCIGTSQSTAIYLYKQGAGLTGNYYTNPDCSDISVTGVVSPEGSGTVTLTAGSGKTGDKVYAMYTPDEDYNFDEWSISGTGSTLGSTTAVVTEITIGSANTTVTANFVAKDWKTITWKANGVALTGGDLGSASVKVENGFDITALPPTPTSCDGTSTTFIGWVEESDVWSGPTDDVSGVTIYEDVSDFPTVTDDVTYHAVWARQNGSAAPATYAGTGVFTKITTLEELEVGAHYVLYGTKDDDASVKGAMNNTFTVEASGKNVFGASAVTISDNKITNPATTIVWKLGGTTNAYTLYSQNSSKYVEITANDTRGYTNPSSPTTSFTITVSEGNFKIITNYASASSRMITIYTASVFRSYSYLTEGYTLNLYKYGSNYTYDRYLVKCCEDPELEFGQTRYSLIREDLHGNTSEAYSTIELTYSSESSGTIRVWNQYDEDDNPEHSTKTAWQYTGANTWGTSPTTEGTAATAGTHAYFAITDAENGKATFYVKNATASNGRGTYRVALHQAADATHCETVTYCWIDVTLRDKFVDAVNGNTFPNADAHGPGEPAVTTPAESTRDAAKDDDCHETTRRLVGWVKETDMDSWYGTSSDRTRDLDDKTANITAPGATITTSGATWYAVWGIEE